MTAWYVDSVTGNDANAGTSPAAPVKTIAQAETLAVNSGDVINLFTGAVWNESLLSNVNVSVAAYGSGASPKLECADVLVAGSWTKSAGLTNVYEQSSLPVAWVSGGKYQNVNVWENGTQLAQVASAAACDSTAGSYYYATLTSTTMAKLQIHASDGSNPASSGKVYTYSRRDYGIQTAGTSATVTGITTDGNLQDDGSLIITGNSLNCTANNGGKHNVFVAPGSTHTNLAANNGYFNGGSFALVVCNENVGNNENTTFINPVVTNAVQDVNATGILSHLNVSGQFGTMTISGGYFSNLLQGVEAAGHQSLIVTNSTASNCFHLVDVAQGDLTGSLSVQNCSAYGSSMHETILVGGTLTGGVTIIGNNFTNNGNSQPMVGANGLSGGTLTMSGNTFSGNSGAWGLYIGSSVWNVCTGNTFIGTLNYFYFDVDPTKITSDWNWFPYIGANAFMINNVPGTLADWRAASGQDTHSGVKITNLTATVSGDSITIAWDAVTDGSLADYQVIFNGDFTDPVGANTNSLVVSIRNDLMPYSGPGLRWRGDGIVPIMVFGEDGDGNWLAFSPTITLNLGFRRNRSPLYNRNRGD